jgi:hypothetical protein
MRRTLAALLGCLLTLTANWVWAADGNALLSGSGSATPLSSSLPDLGGPA